MGQKIEYTCDVCGKLINSKHQQLFMVTIVVNSTQHCDDGSASGTENVTDTYYVHNDFSKNCMRKIWKLLDGGKKDEDSGT